MRGGQRETVRLRIWLYITFLFVAAAAVVATSVAVSPDAAPALPVLCLPLLAAGLVAAEVLRVRARRGQHIESLTLSEAIVAPLIFAYPTWEVVLVVAAAQLVTGPLRKSDWTKGTFNLAQSVLGAAAGSVLIDLLSTRGDVGPWALAVLVVALTAVALVNHLAVLLVMTIAEDQSLIAGFRGFVPLWGRMWLGWLVNLVFGLLFVFAVSATPVAIVLVPAPLVLLYFAYRGYAAAQADGRRLEGLRSASRVLSEPIDPLDAIPGYLREVSTAFEAREAVLALQDEDGSYRTYTSSSHSSGPRPATPLEGMLAGQSEPLRVRQGDAGAFASALVHDDWRECISAPLLDDHDHVGVLVVFDQAGFEGTRSAELAVLEALARETAHTLARGRLLENVMEQERKLNQVVSSTSDGIFSLSDDGTLLTWNAACEQITGYAADEVLGRRDLTRSLEVRTAAGKPVNLGNWVRLSSLPRELLVTTKAGAQRRLSCSATSATDSEGERSLVVIARDITPAEEYQELREQFSQLVEAQAAQRLVVDHLQQAVAPEPPGIDGADIAVRYVASDPTSPTGGDLFDWHELPSGELHVAVVDVLGHGVVATKDALTVVHTLRFAAVEGTPLEDIVSRADELLSAQESDLVATVVVARYDPESGELRVVSGGHPPALVVAPGGEVTPVSATGGAIGWPAVGSDNVARAHLDVHDSVILYTDGLIEARKDIIEGMDSLSQVASDIAHLPAQHFADELVRRSLAGADRRDDSLALVLRRTRKSVVAPRARWRLDPGEHHGLRRIRKELQDWLAAHQVEQEDVVLVAAELLANGRTAARSTVVLNVCMETGQVTVEVSDDGPGSEALDGFGRRLPTPEHERGRGLYLVRALSDDVTAMSTTEGTVVRATIPVTGITTSARRWHSKSHRF